MSKPFDATAINNMELRNRFVRSATWEGMCDDHGRPTEKLAHCYHNLAKGKVGLIITGFTYIRPDGKQLPGKMGLYSDDFKKEMKGLVKAVHDEGGKICIQLVHAGGQSNSSLTGSLPVAPSAVEAAQFPEMPQALLKDDIFNLIDAFGKAARRALVYGFDAVQLHGAHGYLINQFLSPLTNVRDDEYGGNLENRCRFLIEVYNRIRQEVGPDYPVMIKLNASDNIDGGLAPDDSIEAAKMLDKAGIDAIEISSGTPASGADNPVRVKIDSPEKEGYNLDFAGRIKREVKCPVMSVGGFRSLEVIERAIKDNNADFISLSRPLIREPGLVSRWDQGDGSPAKCISCNGCFTPGQEEGGIYCVMEKREATR